MMIEQLLKIVTFSKRSILTDFLPLWLAGDASVVNKTEYRLVELTQIK